MHMASRIVFQSRWVKLAGATAIAVQLNAGTSLLAQGNEPVTPPKVLASNATQPATIPVYTVADCIHVAFERQPALTAARHSVAAKQAASNGLNRFNINYLFAPDISYRRQQSCKGVSAAQAELMQAEIDTNYAVTRTYFTAIYARLQYDVTAEILTKLELDRADLKRSIDAGAKDYNSSMLDRLDIGINLAKARQLEADAGMNRALAALREAMGIGLECSSFQLADLSLPDPKINVDRCDIVNMALARRGELMQVLIAADIFHLEVDAQGRFCFRTLVRTFANAGDIHSQPVPPGIRNGDYRPGAIGFEMPVNLAGPRNSRVEQACQYSGRADAVVAKTKELIALEAEDGFAKWNEAVRKSGFTKDATDKAQRYIRQLEEDRAGGAKILPEDMTTSRILAATAAAAKNEAMYQQVLALANLERITAGGFSAGFSPTHP
jgi:outer membrane protein TolC